MNNKIKAIIIIITIILVASISPVFANLVTSAANISLTSNKTSKTKVSEALDELYENIGGCPNGSSCYQLPTSIPTDKKCRRALSLHVEKCNQDSSYYYCSATNYMGGDIVEGSNIVYGKTTYTEGNLTPGEAFTCDVNGDGYFDETKERFYYISDYYDTSTKSFRNNVAVLLYYSNVENGVPSLTKTYAYHNAVDTSQGPTGLYSHLPTTSQWSNVSLYATTRKILDHYDTYYKDFSYSGYAARLLTYNEIKNVTGSSLNYSGEFSRPERRFLLENTSYAYTNGPSGYWLETPKANNGVYVWSVFANNQFVANGEVNISTYLGVRPAIDVYKSDISY